MFFQDFIKSTDQYLRSYLFINSISKSLGFDPIFFDFIDESIIQSSLYALHHINPYRPWSIYPIDIMLTSAQYHGTYPTTDPSKPGIVSIQDTEVLLKGMQKLIEIGISNFKKGVAPTSLITENDITNVLGRYILKDGRTVLQWWKQGSKTQQPATSFNDRLKKFNEGIHYLAANGQDYEMLVNYLYPKRGPNWISMGKLQMDTYLFMMRHPSARKQLHMYVHLEDIIYVRKTWGVW